jgi:chromate reductase, NAD(P)H dehydrogenase (quinone)
MITIISGTNRPNANTLALSYYYKTLLESLNQQAQVIDLALLPSDFLVSGLYANRGKNEIFNNMVSLMKPSEKMVFVVPEYNGSFPGVLKLFIDGLDFRNEFKNKKAALLGISQGNMGGALALSHLTDILNYMGMYVIPLKLRIPVINSVFSAGAIQNEATAKLISEQATALINF